MLTAGTLASAQELIASWLAKDRNKHGNYFTARVPKMAAYGALVSAPLGHFLIWALQKTFKGRTSLRAKILQILVSNLIVSGRFPCPAEMLRKRRWIKRGDTAKNAIVSERQNQFNKSKDIANG